MLAGHFLSPLLTPLLAGALLGLSATILLLFIGRISGISGILYGVLFPQQSLSHSASQSANSSLSWRILYLLGLFTGGILLHLFSPSVFGPTTQPSPEELQQTMLAGLLVGLGSILANGCTSGHGVCGISRFSPRSMIVTTLFILAGCLTRFFLQPSP